MSRVALLGSAVRFVGLIALLWTHWPLALTCIMALGLGGVANYYNVLNSKAARVGVEIFSILCALYGISIFPLVSTSAAQGLTGIAIILYIISIFVPSLKKH